MLPVILKDENMKRSSSLRIEVPLKSMNRIEIESQNHHFQEREFQDFLLMVRNPQAAFNRNCKPLLGLNL